MLKIRGIIVGILLLAGVIVSAEYYLRSDKSSSLKLSPQTVRFAGWKPSETMYLTPPVSRTIKQTAESGRLINVRYDENGFRVGPKKPTQKNHILFLGDECTLATNVEAEQTYIAIWQEKQDRYLKQFSLRSGRFVNAAQPDGCPLLWLLQDHNRFARFPVKFVMCVLTPQSFRNDLQVRRSITFDSQGFPVSGYHPYARPLESKQPTQFDNLIQSQLVKLGIPILRELFLGKETDKNQGSALKRIESDLISSSEREALAMMALEPLIELRERIRSRGGEVILVYLPDMGEVLTLKRKMSSGKTPVLLATKTGQAVLDEKSQNYRNIVRDFAQKHQFRLCDTSTFFISDQSPERYFSEDRIRLSIEGHEKIAELLMDFFSDKTAESQTERKR